MSVDHIGSVGNVYSWIFSQYTVPLNINLSVAELLIYTFIAKSASIMLALASSSLMLASCFPVHELQITR